MRVNNATLTGEASPVSRDTAVHQENDLLRSRNVLLAGKSLTTGEATALVFATGMHTAFGRIARLTQTTTDVPSPLQTEIARLSRLIAILAVTIGVFVFASAHSSACRLAPVLSLRLASSRERAGRITSDRDAGDGHGVAANGTAAHAGATPCQCRNTRVRLR